MDNGANNYYLFLNGNDDGITEIIKEYKDGLILFINRYINNIYISEELAEDTFFKLVIKKPKFNDTYSFKTWLYTIGRNIALNYIKHNKKLVSIQDNNLDNMIADKNEIEKVYIKQDNKLIIYKAISNLNIIYCQVLHLKFFEELSNEQIAKIMKKNKRQIENLLFRAKQLLKAELEKEGFTYENLC